MDRIAVFPGSFDPVTIGHQAVVQKALPLFDKIYVAVGYNTDKSKGMFSLEERLDLLRKTFQNEPKIEVGSFDGLTAEYCKNVGAGFIVRGLRSGVDFDYEKPIAEANQKIGDGIETVFFIAQGAFAHVKSSIVRDILSHGGDASSFLPENVNL